VPILIGADGPKGLAVAAELAQAHGGRLTAASELGQGTQMTLSLPSA